MLAFTGFEPGTAALKSVLEMHNCWKEIYISKMNFINPKLNFKNDTRKIKTRDIHNSKKGIHK
jgi:hypothetical protein